MAKISTSLSFATLVLDQRADAPLYRQLYQALRQAILTGRLSPGTRLPSSRELAMELGVSRNTIVNAFEQLLAEGYVEGKIGAGTYVARTLPDELFHAPGGSPRSAAPSEDGRSISKRGQRLLAVPTLPPARRGEPRAFQPGVPALDAFPFDLWRQLLTKHWRRPSRDVLSYNHPAGYPPLRAAIAAYLGAARAVQCVPEQVIIINGAQQGLDLAARLLLDPGDAAWIEEPGYPGARGAFLAAGASLVPVPVDKEGLDIVAGEATQPDARLVYVSPSHQYPLGVTMSLSRRLALLAWAQRAGAWIIEDDYDSEYRYAGRPLASLQGLDTAHRVIYLGTFSKVLFPALRLGYLVVPPDLVDAFTALRALVDRHSPILEQAVLADFMAEGHFARHIRRMRVLYAERQGYLLDAARHKLAGLLEIEMAEAGMHLPAWLPEAVDDVAAYQQAAIYGVDAPPLSAYCIEPEHASAPGRRPRRQGALLLGYANCNQQAIDQGVERLARALSRLQDPICKR
jgi:GntR family transcriptional regulator/MocR family aminotransferase